MITIRFVADSRHGDWTKGQHGTITKTLAVPPQNQFTIYIVKLEDGTEVWATDKDVQPWNQLSLF